MRIAITGTSGVGKTYLESKLHDSYSFIQIPKYTNRPQRPGEIEGMGIYFVDDPISLQDEMKYFFRLDYMGYTYAWKNQDLQNNLDKNITIGITLESLPRILNADLGFIPILLFVDVKDISLLESRIKKQLDYDNLDAIKKIEAEKIIEKRINASIQESNNIDKYIEILSKHKLGKAFRIKDDSTINKEVIPYILSLHK